MLPSVSPDAAFDRTTTLPVVLDTAEGREAFVSHVRTLAHIHQTALERMLLGDDDLQLVAGLLEDIGNRYLDYSELISAGVGSGGAHV